MRDPHVLTERPAGDQTPAVGRTRAELQKIIDDEKDGSTTPCTINIPVPTVPTAPSTQGHYTFVML